MILFKLLTILVEARAQRAHLDLSFAFEQFKQAYDSAVLHRIIAIAGLVQRTTIVDELERMKVHERFGIK